MSQQRDTAAAQGGRAGTCTRSGRVRRFCHSWAGIAIGNHVVHPRPAPVDALAGLLAQCVAVIVIVRVCNVSSSTCRVTSDRVNGVAKLAALDGAVCLGPPAQTILSLERRDRNPRVCTVTPPLL